MSLSATEAKLVDGALAALLQRYPDPATADPVEFLGAQFDAGLAWAHFAPGRGGLGVSAAWQPDAARRLAHAGAPLTLGDFVAVNQVAATLHAMGGPRHEGLLRRIFTGQDHWCQLFSEPDAGSDLAGISAIAERDGDVWRVTGQKVWTSGAREADYALLLARTDPDQTKHRGMTMFILPMASDGVEIRPLRQADGGARFNEVFLEDARVFEADRLGDVGAGWRVAMNVLGTERDGASNIFVRPIDELLALWSTRRSTAAPATRDAVLRLWIEAKVIGLNEERQRTTRDADEKSRLSAIAKVASSEYAQRLACLSATVAGPAALVGYDYEANFAADMHDSTSSPTKFHTMQLQTFIVRSRAMSIEGGTNEISRNIAAERVLGLPPDIRVDKDRPWREVRNR